MRLRIIFFALLFFAGCQKEDINISVSASDTFYVENDGASMRLLVEGNTAGKVFILLVAGGPGIGSYVYNTDYISESLENSYAMVYWDQRNSGASQGTSNGENLRFDQILDDLGKVIAVLKKRYGNDIELFLLSHSFGGLVAAGFITQGDNQNLFKGYINVNASHNYPLNDSITRDMLLAVGIREVGAGRHVKEWNKIIGFCNAHTGNFTFDESLKLEKYASDAEGYIDSVKKVNFFPILLSGVIINRFPFTSMLVNLLYSENSYINREISVKEYSSVLNKITIPSLVISGKYDFVCPQELGFDFYSRTGSAYKKMVISPISGHNIMFQDKELFSREVSGFIEQIR